MSVSHRPEESVGRTIRALTKDYRCTLTIHGLGGGLMILCNQEDKETISSYLCEADLALCKWGEDGRLWMELEWILRTVRQRDGEA